MSIITLVVREDVVLPPPDEPPPGPGEGILLVVNSGLNHVRDLLRGDSVTGLTSVSVGTDNATPAPGQTALVNEVFEMPIADMVPLTSSLRVLAVLGGQHGNGQTLRELGLKVNGTLYARGVMDPIVKDSSQNVLFDIDLPFASVESA